MKVFWSLEKTGSETLILLPVIQKIGVKIKKYSLKSNK